MELSSDPSTVTFNKWYNTYVSENKNKDHDLIPGSSHCQALTNDNTNLASDCKSEQPITKTTNKPTSVNRTVEERVKSRKKCRLKTQRINSALANLRRYIPNVSMGTRLTKIRILRLAVSYITYLNKLVHGPFGTSLEKMKEGFRADLPLAKRTPGKRSQKRSAISPGTSNSKRSQSKGKPRTRRPQTVLADSLKQLNSK